MSGASISAGNVVSESSITDNSVVRGDGGLSGIQGSSVLIDDSGNITGANSLTLDTALGIPSGGTGEVAKTAAFDALAPTTTKADVVVFDGSNNIRLAVGTDDQVLTADAAQASGVKWGTVSPGISGSTGATDNAILRSDGVGGSSLQNSAVTVDDTGYISIPDGAFNVPSIRFANSTDTGIASTAVGEVSLLAGGNFKFKVASSLITVNADMSPASTGRWRLDSANTSVTEPPYAFHNDLNTGMYRPDADQIGLTAGGIAAVICKEASSRAWTEIPDTLRHDEIGTAPSNPTVSAQVNVYVKGDKYIVSFDDAGTMKYRYMDLTSVDAAWTYTTSAP